LEILIGKKRSERCKGVLGEGDSPKRTERAEKRATGAARRVARAKGARMVRTANMVRVRVLCDGDCQKSFTSLYSGKVRTKERAKKKENYVTEEKIRAPINSLTTNQQGEGSHNCRT
jgi:hypothetical protein